MSLRILHVEDSALDAELVKQRLELENVASIIDRVWSREQFEEALRRGAHDIIISDFALPGFDGMSALKMAKSIKPDLPFIFLSGTIGEERAIESLKNGAADYVLKDRISRLVAAVERAYQDALDRRKRKAIEAELEHRNELFRQITESVDDLVAVVSPKGEAIFTSPSYHAVFGASSESARFVKAVHPDDAERLKSAFSQIVETGIPQRLGYRVIDLVGRTRHLESQWSAIRSSPAAVSNIVIVSRDVTEREQAARKIRQQAELLNEARDAIFVRDMEQRVTFWNRGAERLYGWKTSEALGQLASELLYRPGSPHREEIWKVILEKGEWQGELIQITKDGKEVHVDSRRTLLRGTQGEPIAVLNINTNISEKKDLEAQVLRSQRLDTLGSLASGIAHDLNNVLAPILMATELLHDRVEGDESRRMLDVSKNSARRGADLVKQILQFARGGKNEHAVVSMATLVKELAKFAQNTFPPLIKVQTKIEGDCKVKGDATQLHQIVLNLCVNARDAMPGGGFLTISCKDVTLSARHFPAAAKPIAGEFVELAVRDTGTGIPAEILPRIFEPFFTTKTQDKGTGLGLSTVASIVRNHNGFVDVESQVGKGTAFLIYLPQAPSEIQTHSGAKQSTLPSGHGEWILLVDDELALLEMTKQILEAYGYNVVTARNGSEALVHFGANQAKIKVVITDLLMPGLGGQQLIDAIHGLAPHVIAICVSGSADEVEIRSDTTGAMAFLRKPCPTADLLNTLARVLKHS